MFNYKDYTYLRMAIVDNIERLSSIEEDHPGVGADRFSEIQDDIQYLNRLQQMVEREIATLQSPPKAVPSNLRAVPKQGQSG